MTYLEGFVAPVSEHNKDAYREHASRIAPILKEFGIRRIAEGWADEVPRGNITDFYRAVAARDGETVVFSFFEYESKAARDAANEKFATDPRLSELGANVPFDAKRMILGGFQAIVEAGDTTGSYLNGFVAPVPANKKETYRALTERHASVFREYGALRLVQAWGDDVPHGRITDFHRAVQATPDEVVVFSFIEWASKEASSNAWAKLMKDERMQPSGDMPFDGKRMFWGGFQTIFDTAEPQMISVEVPLGK
ncbi:MAG TPA: DUF1428 domain-containing protein [Sphingomicrobium sp.]|nr:DUF1428 domain-containing protein [Sphingomicrobium sp.]